MCKVIGIKLSDSQQLFISHIYNTSRTYINAKEIFYLKPSFINTLYLETLHHVTLF